MLKAGDLVPGLALLGKSAVATDLGKSPSIGSYGALLKPGDLPADLAPLPAEVGRSGLLIGKSETPAAPGLCIAGVAGTPPPKRWLAD